VSGNPGAVDALSSYALPELVRSISRERLVDRWGVISPGKLNEITHRVRLLVRA
jgi:mRNA-degrading endonuclease toxin of MazEF toxin-antitoxin module